MAANQITVKAWKGATADIPTASVAENGRLAFYVDTSASTHVVKVCRKVSGTPTWQDVAIASEVLSTTILTTRGDLLVQGASGADRLAVGALGQQLRSIGSPLIPTWVDAAKQGTAASRSAANEAHMGVPFYTTDTYGVAIGVTTGPGTYAWTGFSQAIQFEAANVAAGDNATASASTPVQAQWGSGVTVGWVAPRAGSVRSLTAALSAAAAGSDLILGVYKNGTLIHASAILTLASASSATKGNTTFPLGSYTFAAGDVLDVRVRTGSGWSATTADLGITVEVEC